MIANIKPSQVARFKLRLKMALLSYQNKVSPGSVLNRKGGYPNPRVTQLWTFTEFNVISMQVHAGALFKEKDFRSNLCEKYKILWIISTGVPPCDLRW